MIEAMQESRCLDASMSCWQADISHTKVCSTACPTLNPARCNFNAKTKDNLAGMWVGQKSLCRARLETVALSNSWQPRRSDRLAACLSPRGFLHTWACGSTRMLVVLLRCSESLLAAAYRGEVHVPTSAILEACCCWLNKHTPTSLIAAVAVQAPGSTLTLEVQS